MSDIKRYYYLKLKDNFFDSEEIKILESLPNGIYYSNLLMKLYLKSLKSNGALKFNDYIPYDEKMIATITNLNIDIVRSGLKVLSSMKFIERLDDGTIYMMNVQNFIGKSNSEADRKRAYREKIEEKKLRLENTKDDSSGQMSEQIGQMSTECPNDDGTNCADFLDKHPPEIETRDRDKDKVRDKETDIDNESINILKDFEKITGCIGGLNLGAVKSAVEMHGAQNVKEAMNRALARGRPTMLYINGILKNWAKEGYPEGGEYYGNRSIGKNNETGSNEFAGFKPHKPRTLTEEERITVEKELI